MRPRSTPTAKTFRNGFTLVELLIYATIASVILAAAASTVLSSIRSSTNLEVERRGIETWTRITQFIESEAAVGTEILIGERYWDCIDSSGVKRSVTPNEVQFSIAVPAPEGTNWQPVGNPSVYQRSAGRVLIHYALRKEAGFLRFLRCGPPYDAQTGELKFDSDKAYETMIHPRTMMELDPTRTTQNRVTYSINFMAPASSTAVTKPIFTSPRRATATTGQQLID